MCMHYKCMYNNNSNAEKASKENWKCLRVVYSTISCKYLKYGDGKDLVSVWRSELKITQYSVCCGPGTVPDIIK